MRNQHHGQRRNKTRWHGCWNVRTAPGRGWPPVEAVEQKIEEIEQPIEDTEQPEPPVQEIVQEIYTEPQELPVSIINEVNKEVENELKNVTLDISNQTLAVLAESIARKITYDVADFIKKTDFIEDAVQLGEYKKDNKLMLEKIDELISDNKILIQRIEELEKENKSFVKVFGNIYVKNR